MKGVHGALLLPIYCGWESGGAFGGGEFRDDTVWEFDFVAFRNWSIYAPHWFIALCTAVIATVPWIYPLVSRRKQLNPTT
jgi:hypothetical protein